MAFVFVSLWVGYLKWRELFYYEIEVSRTDSEFENAVLATANKLNWRIDNLNNQKAEATAYNPWKSRDAQTIKIDRRENKILINSMIEQDFISVPDFFGVNRTNRNTFLHYYYISNKIENLNEEVVQRLNEERERIENESVWSLKNFAKRLIAYVFCFGFIGLGFAIWKSEGLNLAVVLLGIIGLGYIAFDIYAMCAKVMKTNS